MVRFRSIASSLYPPLSSIRVAHAQERPVGEEGRCRLFRNDFLDGGPLVCSVIIVDLCPIGREDFACRFLVAGEPLLFRTLLHLFEASADRVDVARLEKVHEGVLHWA